MVLSLPLLLLLTLTPQEASQATGAEETDAALARNLELPDLGPDDLVAWRDHVRPRGDETAFEGLPWIPEFAEGVKAADRAGKPLLFWAMNGHPLGCT